MPYQPIENYGLIGNLHTAALVGMDGSIDWLCLPRFDSPSLFAALLDDDKGGQFRIAPPQDGLRHKQFYWPDTNILVTRFLHPDGVGQLEDFMPVGPAAGPSPNQLIRRVRVVRGEMSFRLDCQPAFDYGRAPHTTATHERGARFESADMAMGLASSIPLRQQERGPRGAEGDGIAAEFTLTEGEAATFVLRVLDRNANGQHCPGTDEAELLFRETVDYWHKWLAKCTYRGRWREVIQRSALTLKLLTYEPTGAMVAAPTTSLPERIGGGRNWDYRYTWIRDSAFMVYAFLRIGFTEEATQFLHWLSERFHEERSNCEGPMQLMYTVDGGTDLTEIELPHLEGYRGSGPVRIGNGAHGQLQLDLYGELMDAVYLHNKYARPVSYDSWTHLRRLVDWVAENWDQPDHGIWETRGGKKDHVFSRFMCWVALDRGLRLADKRSLPADRAAWLAARDAIYEQVMERGWSDKARSFVQAYGTENLDASLLLMPLTFFMAPDDPRMLATVDAIRRPAKKGGLAADGLVYRYDFEATHDGLAGSEGTFNMCSFWLVEALTRAGRTDRKRLAEARLLFEQMLGYGNHLGLYGEQTGPSGEALGNFPQAFTHLALISAAFNLDRALGDD